MAEACRSRTQIEIKENYYADHIILCLHLFLKHTGEVELKEL